MSRHSGHQKHGLINIHHHHHHLIEPEYLIKTLAWEEYALKLFLQLHLTFKRNLK